LLLNKQGLFTNIRTPSRNYEKLTHLYGSIFYGGLSAIFTNLLIFSPSQSWWKDDGWTTHIDASSRSGEIKMLYTLSETSCF